MPLEEASVSLDDRGYYFGDGVYEVVMAFDGAAFALEDHLNRWEYSMGEMRLTCPYGREELRGVIREAVKKAREPVALIYFQVTRGVAPRAHVFPPEGTPGSFMLTAQAYPESAEVLERGEAALLVEDIRWHRCDVKSINLLPNVLAAQQAAEAGCAHALLHRGDVVTECASANAYIVKDGTLFTHPLGNLILPGTTRAHILKLAVELGIPVQEVPFTVDALLAADEVLCSAVARRPGALVRINDVAIGDGRPGPVTRRLQAAYAALVADECKKA